MSAGIITWNDEPWVVGDGQLLVDSLKNTTIIAIPLINMKTSEMVWMDIRKLLKMLLLRAAQGEGGER